MALGVQWLPGLAPEADAPDANAWAMRVVAVADNPTSNVAVTPALAAQKLRVESTWRAVRWAGMAALVGAGIAASYYAYSRWEAARSDERPPSAGALYRASAPHNRPTSSRAGAQGAAAPERPPVVLEQDTRQDLTPVTVDVPSTSMTISLLTLLGLGTGK